ncbi:MAG: type II toxin-antitoxin system VapC family toxin [Candidatus Rokubacteria bacterium]|nr:type II toxin-antitoxin system VapC family toxin [Candidatus Rokubacteria bacterium]
MIHLDTSVLIDAFTGPKRSAAPLRNAIDAGERIALSAVTLYEWLRGPRLAEEIAAQQGLLPPKTAVPFGPDEAVLAATLYRVVPGARRRVADLAIAACALTHGATLWTLNPHDFEDIPDLTFFVAKT